MTGVTRESEIIDAIHAEIGGTKADAKRAWMVVKDKIEKDLSEGKRVEITGVVSMYPRLSKERKGRNPQTGEAITIPAQVRMKAKVAKAIATAANENDEVRNAVGLAQIN